MYRQIRIFLFSIFILSSLHLRSQINLDSIADQLKNEPASAEAIQRYIKIISQPEPDNRDVVRLISEWLLRHSDNDSLREYQAEINFILGKLYMDISNYEKAAQYYTASQVIAERYQLLVWEAKAINGLAGIYYSNKQIDKAIEYYQKAIDISERGGYARGIAIGRYNIGGLLLEKGYGNPDTVNLSFQLMRGGVDLVRSIKDTLHTITLGIGLGQSYILVKKIDSALWVLASADTMIRATNNERAYMSFYLRKAEICHELKNYSQAIKYYKTGLDLTLKYNNRRLSYNYYQGLAETYAQMGDFKQANHYNRLYIRVHDSLVSKQSFAITAGYQNRYEQAKKDNEILRLNDVNQQKESTSRIYIASIVLLIFLGVSISLYIKHRSKIAAQRLELYQQRISELEKDLQLLAVDAVLKGQEEERGRIAKDLHDGLGGLLSSARISFLNLRQHAAFTEQSSILFDKSMWMLEDTIRDLRRIAHNLMPESLMKFGLPDAVKDFCAAVQYQYGLDILFYRFGDKRVLSHTTEIFAYRIVQELVDNVVRHSGATKLIVQLSIRSNALGIEVEDDGRGFDIDTVRHGPGVGFKNISYRVKYFNGIMHITTGIAKGTFVNIELKA